MPKLRLIKNTIRFTLDVAKILFWPKKTNVFSSLLLGLVVAGLFSGAFYAFATPPASPYAPGETTNPSCSPTDPNCTVVASVPYTGATANVDLGSKTLTTTGAGTFGNITDSAMTSGSILFAGTAGILSQSNSKLFWNNTTNRLGIGTNTPLAPLDVVNATANIFARFWDGSGSYTLKFSNGEIGDELGLTDGNDGIIAAVNRSIPGTFFYGDQGPGGITIKPALTGGTVGIGTTLPTAKLHVVSNNTAVKTLVVQVIASQTANLQEWQNSAGTALASVSAAGLGSFTGLTIPSGTITFSGFSTNGGLLYTNGSGVVAQTGAGTSTTLLHGGTTPSYSAVSLTADVTGVLPVANGGTGTTTALTQGSIVFAGASGVYTQDNSNFFWNDTTNRLGIGTTTPFGRIDIAGTSAAVGGAEPTYPGDIRINNDGGASGNEGGLEFYNSGLSNGYGARIQSPNDVGSNPVLYFQTRSNSATWSTKMTILGTDGKVGIGTTSPSAFLHVLGTTEQQRIGYDTSNYYKTTVGSTGGVTFDAVGSGSAFTFSDAVTFSGSVTNSALTAGRVTFAGTAGVLTDDGDLTFATDTLSATKLLSSTSVSTPSLISTGAITMTPGAGTNFNLSLSTTGDFAVNTNQLYVDTSLGYVGIGTASPSQKLDVAGNINISSGSAYMYNSVNVITAQTASENFFFGNSGNLTMTGLRNTASGMNALLANTTGNDNTASGNNALAGNTTGLRNTASGQNALLANTTGNDNTTDGMNSLIANTTGSNNTASGKRALSSNTTGSNNTASGMNVLFDLNITANDGSGNNTAVGYNTGRGIVTGINNTIIGANVTGLSAALSNNIIIADGEGTQRIAANSSGILTFSGYTTNGGLLYTNGSGVVAQTGAGTSTTILHGGTTPSYSAVSLTADVSGILPVANGGTNCSSASITCFNNITGFTAAGTTGTTSTNLVFSTSPTLVTPVLGVATGTSLALTYAGTTATTTSSGLVLNANSLTTGTGLYVASSTLTSGLLVDLQVSGTAAAASQTALNILTAGATATNAITTYGAQISNTHTNATSGTNVALYLNASGATTANYGLIVNAGNVGIGTTAPARLLDVTSADNINGIRVKAVSPTLELYTTTAIANNRNWSINTNYNVAGSLEVLYSSANNTDPSTTAFTIDRTGNVGIGTTSPTAQLSLNASPATNAVGASISFKRADTSSYAAAIWEGENGAYDFLKFGVGSGANPFADAQVRMTILASGNVGIGTMSPGGTLAVLSGVTTGTTTSSATSISANSLTTGTGLYVASSTLTSGLLVDLQVSGTAAAASQTALNILTAGATATNAITTYGAQISNTHTNATSGTNVALYLNASGATTANYGLIVNAGNVGIGTTTPGYKLEVNGTGWFSNKVAIGGSAALGSDSLDVFSSGTAPTAVIQNNGAGNGSIILSIPVGVSVTGGVSGLRTTITSSASADIDIYQSGAGTARFNALALSTGDAQSTYAINGGQAWSVGLDNSDSDKFKISGNSTLGTSDYMTIDTSGNVGIGTTTPSALLEVRNGTANYNAPTMSMFSSNSNTGVAFGGEAGMLLENTNNTAGNYIGFDNYDSTGTVNAAIKFVNVAHSASAPKGAIAFVTRNTGAYATQLYINEDGNVGIGDTTPASLFTVGNGDLFQVNSSGAIVASAGYIQGSGTFSLTSANTTQVTTASAMALNVNSLTTGTGLYAASSSLTSGKLVDLQVSGTAAAASQTALNILTAGATATNAITSYGAQISNTHTNATSGTNVALYLNASGATTANYGLIVNAGYVGIGTTAPGSPLDIVSGTTTSMRLDTTAVGGTDIYYGLYTGGGNQAGKFGYVESGQITYLDAVRGGTIAFRNIGTEAMRITSGGNVGIGTTAPTGNLAVTQTVTATGVLKGIVYTGAVNTNQTASTEIPSLTLTTAGRQWATGALTTQREVVITAPTYSFVGASTITNAVTLDIGGAPVAGTNATITQGAALRLSGSSVFATAALATNATNGFIYAPSSAGAPTGTPETWTGTVPIEYDTTNNRLYAYRGGAWHYFAETAGFQIPNLVTDGVNETDGMAIGDFVIGQINEQMSDGAFHGLYKKFDLVTEMGKYLGTFGVDTNGTLIADIQNEAPHNALAAVSGMLANDGKILVNFVAARVTAVRGYFDEVFAKKVHTEQICVKKADGTEVCVNGDQLQTIVNGGGNNGSSTSGGGSGGDSGSGGGSGGDGVPSGDSAPVITLVGDATMTLTVGDTFTEPGYTATDNVDGNITANVQVIGSVDTATAGTYVLTYTVSDLANNVGTATRTVNVVAPSAPEEVPPPAQELPPPPVEGGE